MKEKKSYIQVKNLVTILLILTSSTFSLTECPEGCYSCVYESEKIGKRRKKMIKMSSEGYKVKCMGCWHNRLGEDGCPPKKVKQDKCLLYYESGICMVCEKGYIPKTFADHGYLNSKCIKSQEESIIWGFYDHERSIEFMRVCEGKFPIQFNSRCKKFSKGDFLAENCEWGTGHRGCPKCFKCKKGYISIYGVCRKAWIGIRGCMNAVNEDFCAYCDHWRGYYMDMPGHCKKYKKKDKSPESAKRRCTEKFIKQKSPVLMNYAMFD